MKIRYLGHACFLLEGNAGTRILTDPYGEIGYPLPRVEADVVTVSHGHYDHCNVQAVSGNPMVFYEEGDHTLEDISITSFVSFHDEEKGAKRGKNGIFRFSIDGIKVCHLGDLGEPCSASLTEKLLPTDVLLIPVGGIYTIDAKQAKEFVEHIQPSVVIPMHYKTEDLDINIGGVGEFTDLFHSILKVRMVGSELELKKSDLSESGTKIIVMERVKA